MKKLNIALVAHDSRKKELATWFKFNIDVLSQHNLFGTGTTAKILNEVIDEYIEENSIIDDYDYFSVTQLLSGPLGGDQIIGGMIAEGKIDVLIFFCDNLITQGHHQDVGALVRLASLYNIAFATNRTTADMILTSNLFANEDYTPIIPKSIENYKNRKL